MHVRSSQMTFTSYSFEVRPAAPRCTFCKLIAQKPLRQKKPQSSNRGFRGTPTRASSDGSAGFEATMGLLQDPEVCKMMYPFLPDHMRNPEGVKLMMSDPHIRDQVESALKQAFKDNDEVLRGMDVRKSAEELGIDPAGVIKTILSDPDLSQACGKPEILAAVMECSQDSSKLAEYEHQPEVKRILEQIEEMLPK